MKFQHISVNKNLANFMDGTKYRVTRTFHETYIQLNLTIYGVFSVSVWFQQDTLVIITHSLVGQVITNYKYTVHNSVPAYEADADDSHSCGRFQQVFSAKHKESC